MNIRIEGQQHGTSLSCDAAALSEAERSEHRATTERLERAVSDVRRPTDAHEVRFVPGEQTLVDLARFIAREHRCCPFFTFEIRYEQSETLWLRFTGSPEAVSFAHSHVDFGRRSHDE